MVSQTISPDCGVQAPLMLCCTYNFVGAFIQSTHIFNKLSGYICHKYIWAWIAFTQLPVHRFFCFLDLFYGVIPKPCRNRSFFPNPAGICLSACVDFTLDLGCILKIGASPRLSPHQRWSGSVKTLPVK